MNANRWAFERPSKQVVPSFAIPPSSAPAQFEGLGAVSGT